MYNFDFVIPSLLVMCVILAFFVLKPKIPILRYKVFLALLAIQFLVIVFDILSSYTDSIYESVPIPLNIALNMGFFVAYLARTLFFFLFLVVILRVHFFMSQAKRFLVSLVFLICEAITLSSVFTHAVFYIDEGGYHRGPVYFILYINFFFYLLLSLAFIARYRKRLTRYERIGAVSYNIVLIIGNIVRILLPQYLVMNTFCLLAILILFMAFVNTDLYLSDCGAFNQRALEEVLDEKMQKRDFQILCFSLHNSIDLLEVYGIRQLTAGMNMIADYLHKEFPHQIVFHLGIGRFVLIGQREMDTKAIIESLKERFRRPWRSEGVDLYLDAGFIVMSSETGHTSSDAVIDTLLVTMNEISERYGSFETIDLSQGNALERLITVKRALNQAIDEGRVEVFLQPLVHSQTGILAGAEALARIRDESGTIISPNEFIPIAERNGQINPLSDQVMEKVCDFIRQHDMERMGLEYININLSPVQCQNHELYEHIAEIFRRNHVPTHYIHLEITEETMVDFAVLLEQMKNLQKEGFHFALDDYGSGYSNITRVRRFPFVNIKIDMEIVRMHCENPDRMLPTMVELFKDRGFSVTAEGIETKEMGEIMRDIGCDYLQGYYYSRPVPINEFIEKTVPELQRAE